MLSKQKQSMQDTHAHNISVRMMKLWGCAIHSHRPRIVRVVKLGMLQIAKNPSNPMGFTGEPMNRDNSRTMSSFVIQLWPFQLPALRTQLLISSDDISDKVEIAIAPSLLILFTTDRSTKTEVWKLKQANFKARQNEHTYMEQTMSLACEGTQIQSHSSKEGRSLQEKKINSAHVSVWRRIANQS